ncbi:unnamed protein product [Notodromas monacha]|uniref:SET domain-containing protein n=1 Tax=Notodromas monacha TaxID=399045 RepID=A0A7R9BY73_9CRUS|nr:unnamed protein product [Notodromas monacha]CAG0923853.1 unnamed protein product [Notodromas monacha]
MLESALETRCDINVQNKKGDTPLHLAARCMHYECVDLLISRGANLDLRNCKGSTPRETVGNDRMCSLSGLLGLTEVLSSDAVDLRKDEDVGNALVSADHPVPSVSCNAVQIMPVKLPTFRSNGTQRESDIDRFLFQQMELTLWNVGLPAIAIRSYAITNLYTPSSEIKSKYAGECVMKEDALKRCDLTYTLQFANEKFLWIDAKEFGNVARFINHSCEPNLMVIPVLRGSGMVKFVAGLFALRDIRAGEELTMDYGSHVLEQRDFECQCGSRSCVSLRELLPDANAS